MCYISESLASKLSPYPSQRPAQMSGIGKGGPYISHDCILTARFRTTDGLSTSFHLTCGVVPDDTFPADVTLGASVYYKWGLHCQGDDTKYQREKLTLRRFVGRPVLEPIRRLPRKFFPSQSNFVEPGIAVPDSQPLTQENYPHIRPRFFEHDVDASNASNVHQNQDVEKPTEQPAAVPKPHYEVDGPPKWGSSTPTSDPKITAWLASYATDFPGVFDPSKRSRQHLDQVQHHIEILPDKGPVQQPPRRYSPAQEQALREFIDKHNGTILQPSKSN